MGKGVILSHIGSGKYNVRVFYDNVRAQARLLVINNNLTDIAINIPEIESKVLEAYNTMYAKMDEVNTYIANNQGTENFNIEEFNNLNTEFLKLRVDYELILRQQKILLLRKASLENEKARLEANAKDYEDKQLWCADLTTNLGGEVGTIEVAYETNERQSIILPGHIAADNFQAAYSESRDGRLTTYWNQSPAQIYTNRAYLPAWSKWKPRYRTGTITAKDGDLYCDVTLDNYLSSQSSLSVNQSDTLSHVVFRYMTCNGRAFEIGDNVVVAFENQDWAQPVVIGFSSNPKVCPPVSTLPSGFDIYVIPSSDTPAHSGFMYDTCGSTGEVVCGSNGFNYYTSNSRVVLLTDYETSVFGKYAPQIPDIVGTGNFATPNGTEVSGVYYPPGGSTAFILNRQLTNRFGNVRFLSLASVLEENGAYDGKNCIDEFYIPCGFTWVDFSHTFPGITITPLSGFTITDPDTGESGTYAYLDNFYNNIIRYTKV